MSTRAFILSSPSRIHRKVSPIRHAERRDGFPVRQWRCRLQHVPVYVRFHFSLLQMTKDSAADHGMVAKLVFNNFEIADMDLWRGEAYTAFFNYLDHQGGFYYEVRPPLTIYSSQGGERSKSLTASRMNSVGATRPCTRSARPSSGARMASTFSRKSVTNIIRSRTVPWANFGTVAGVRASKRRISVRFVVSRSFAGAAFLTGGCSCCLFFF